MSLATRCTTCGTIFRVVQDQLKVSDGWVRCGRCDAVFDAANELFDLEHDAPPDWQPTAPPPMGPAPVEPTAGDAAESESDDERRWSASMAAQGLTADASSATDAPTAPTGTPARSAAAVTATLPAPAFQPPAPFVYDGGDAVADDRPGDEADGDAIVITDHPSSLRPSPSPSTSTSASASLRGLAAGGLASAQTGSADPIDGRSTADGRPGFGRRSDRPARRAGGRSRALLAVLALALLLGLTLQAAQQFSELTAARWPALRPVLTAWCGLTHCSVGPPHRIDDIVVENTALSPAPAPAGSLRLTVSLRNRAAYPVALPSIDLSLTDAGGKLIARRALAPADFLVPASALAATADLPLQAVLTAADGTPRVAGYTVEIFYP